jgi:serine/threonine protein kinase
MAMSETKRCPRCQAEIPAGAPEGLCPQCLLQAGLEAKTAEPDSKTAAYSPPATGFTPPPPEELQAAFPQLEILELLGKGGMGAVYKAKQRALDRLVAVKILPPEYSQDPAFAERFLREAKALAMLNHPNIIAIHDIGQTPASPTTHHSPQTGYCYFIMEYVDGLNLRQAMRSGSLKPGEALKIVPQICDALQFANDEGIVHRDIKPENILLDKKGRVKIADFGLAKLLGKTATDVSLTGTQQAMGTLHYMAPEQIEGARDVDHRADIYSLGVTFYEMLTGELPLGRFAVPSQKVQIDVRLDEVVLRSLAKAPEQRYQHASEIKTEVEGIVSTPALAKTAGADTDPELVGKGCAAAFITLISIFSLVFAATGRQNQNAGMLCFAITIIPAVLFIILFVRHARRKKAELHTKGPGAVPAPDHTDQPSVTAKKE